MRELDLSPHYKYKKVDGEVTVTFKFENKIADFNMSDEEIKFYIAKDIREYLDEIVEIEELEIYTEKIDE